MAINLDKILKELSKGDADQQAEAFKPIKEHITKAVQEKQKEVEETANKLQQTLDKMNGTESHKL